MINMEQLNKIGNLQRKALSLINLNSSVDSVMKEEKILSLEEVIKIELIKISADTLPVNLAKNL